MRLLLISLLVMLGFSQPVSAEPAVGKPAPSFETKDIDGKTVKLSDFLGKTVVLEWNNPSCPFVRKHYESKNMQAQQAEATAKGVVWLTINSGSPNKVGSLDAKEAREHYKSSGAASSHYILDPEGKIGRAYAAKTTPHMFVIDAKGNIAYMGAIDDDTSADPTKAKSAKSYVREALADLESGSAVKTASTQSYGCSVKYAD